MDPRVRRQLAPKNRRVAGGCEREGVFGVRWVVGGGGTKGVRE